MKTLSAKKTHCYRCQSPLRQFVHVVLDCPAGPVKLKKASIEQIEYVELTYCPTCGLKQ